MREWLPVRDWHNWSKIQSNVLSRAFNKHVPNSYTVQTSSDAVAASVHVELAMYA